MASYLITGASRDIGLAILQNLSSKPATEVSIIFAAARTQTTELMDIIAQSAGRVQLVPIDIEDKACVLAATATVEKALHSAGLDILINNAGVMNYTFNGIETMDDLDSTFHTNVTSAHTVTSAFLPLLKKGTQKKVINISTSLGSIAMAPRFANTPAPAYKVSKAALNMDFLSIAPGWVKTKLGGESADLTPEQSAHGVLDIILHATRVDNGKFFIVRVPGLENSEGLIQYHGGETPW
ncbi:hypothetical protein BDW75DRAFT_231832 [Aspergillus navahoensis]